MTHREGCAPTLCVYLLSAEAAERETETYLGAVMRAGRPPCPGEVVHLPFAALSQGPAVVVRCDPTPTGTTVHKNPYRLVVTQSATIAVARARAGDDSDPFATVYRDGVEDVLQYTDTRCASSAILPSPPPPTPKVKLSMCRCQFWEGPRYAGQEIRTGVPVVGEPMRSPFSCTWRVVERVVCISGRNDTHAVYRVEVLPGAPWLSGQVCT